MLTNFCPLSLSLFFFSFSFLFLPSFSHSHSSLSLSHSYVYIYDETGTEIHLLKHHIDPLRLDFLRYHFLLVSVGNAGYLKYQVRVRKKKSSREREVWREGNKRRKSTREKERMRQEKEKKYRK